MFAMVCSFAAVVLFDRATKALVFQKIAPGDSILLVGTLRLRPIRTPRPWPGESPLFWWASVAAAAVGALLLLLLQPQTGWPIRIGIGAALGGAGSNVLDRQRLGVVRDFVDLGIGGVFNPADAAIVLGLLAVLLSFAAARV